VLTLLSPKSILCLRSQLFGHEGKNSQHQPTTFLVTTKGYLSWTKVSMTERQTSSVCLRCDCEPLGALLDTPAGGNPLLRTSRKQTSPWRSPCLSLCFCLPEGLSQRGIGLRLLANFGLTAILALGVLYAPFLWVETKPGVDLDTPYAMLEEPCTLRRIYRVL
jgi:hypothetical protein